MFTIKKNIIANFAGRVWTALMSLAFVPLYIEFMGIESYGLVGIFASLLAIFAILDMGLSTTLNRELARLSVLPDKAQQMRNLVQTLQTIYWTVAIIIALAVLGLSSPIAYYWVKTNQLPRATVRHAIMIMGGVIAFQWPLGFYSGGLRGLQKQVLLNCINIGMATLRGIGAVLILWQVSATIQAFFTWQIVISVLHTSTTATFLWSNLARTGHRSRFQKNLLFGIWRFAAGMTGIAVTVLFIGQTDKIVLSRMLTLEMFGYYSFATAAAGALYYLIGPVHAATFPHFSQLAAMHDHTGLKQLYHRSCQLVSIMILPIAIVVSLFSSEILILWTQNPLTVENTHKIVSLLIIGTALNGLMSIPYGLQLAHGWTKLPFYSNMIAIIVLIPAIIFLAGRYGVLGAAVVWVGLNSGYVLICIPVMHSRLLKGEQWRWYLNDVGTPLLAALAIALLWRISVPTEMTRYTMFLYLVGVSTTTLVAAVVVTPYARLWIAQRLLKFRTYCGGETITAK